MIDAPSLEWLEILDYSGGFCVVENDMPKLVNASFDVFYSHFGNVLGSVTSVKRLDLCLSFTEVIFVTCRLLFLLWSSLLATKIVCQLFSVLYSDCVSCC